MTRNGNLRMVRWMLMVLAGTALGLFVAEGHRGAAQASSSTGPLSFRKYALNDSNNAVDVSAATRNWRAHWTFTAGEPLQQASIADGIVYVSGDGGDRRKKLDNRIDAVDASTGRLLWSRRLDNMSMTTPVVGGGLVFVGTGTQQFQGANLALENSLKATGVVRGTGPSAIYALNARTGQVVWHDRTRGEDMPSFVLQGSTLYVANGQGEVYAIQAKSGAVRWSLPIGSYVSMASLTMGPRGTLYVSGAHPYCVDAIDTKTRRMRYETLLPHIFGGSDDSSPAYHNGRLYLEGTGGTWQHPESVLFTLNARTGAILHRTRLGTGALPADIEVSAPVTVGDRVFIGSPITHKEYAISGTSGHILWEFRADGPVSESAAVTRHDLYVGDGNGFLYALNPRTGVELGSLFVSGVFAADFPIVVGQTLYQPDENGQLLAIPRANLLTVNQKGVPRIPIPAGALGQQIIRGESLFMNSGLAPSGRTCETCHLEGGTITTYQNGMVIPSLLGAAAAFPRVENHQVVTLDDQINHCLSSMGGRALPQKDSRLAALNLYLHWLSSGWSVNLTGGSGGPAGGAGGGCK